MSDLTIVSNNMGIDGQGLGLLLDNQQVRRVVASYVGENELFARQFLDGTLDVEFVPQGTLAERLRAGGAGIAGFYTRTGAGTDVAAGKPTMDFDGETYLLERGIVADLALVHAHTADPYGNLRYRMAAQNFNPVVATAGRITIAEVEHLEPDPLPPDEVMTPGIFIDQVILADPRSKPIEQRTLSSLAERQPT